MRFEVEVPLSCWGTLVKERKGAAAAAIMHLKVHEGRDTSAHSRILIITAALDEHVRW